MSLGVNTQFPSSKVSYPQRLLQIRYPFSLLEIISLSSKRLDTSQYPAESRQPARLEPKPWLFPAPNLVLFHSVSLISVLVGDPWSPDNSCTRHFPQAAVLDPLLWLQIWITDEIKWDTKWIRSCREIAVVDKYIIWRIWRWIAMKIWRKHTNSNTNMCRFKEKKNTYHVEWGGELSSSKAVCLVTSIPSPQHQRRL